MLPSLALCEAAGMLGELGHGGRRGCERLLPGREQPETAHVSDSSTGERLERGCDAVGDDDDKGCQAASGSSSRQLPSVSLMGEQR